MSDAITEEYFAKQGRSHYLYASGFGSDLVEGAKYDSSAIPRGATVREEHPQKTPGNIQGVSAKKQKPLKSAVDRKPTIAEDTTGLNDGERTDTIEHVAKRSHRITVSSEKNSKKSPK